MDHLIFEIDKDYQGLEDFVKKIKFSQGFISKAFRQGRVFVGDIPATKSMYVKKGEVLRVAFEEEEIALEGAPLTQEIIYEDQDLLVINKRAGLAIMPCKTHPKATFANEVAQYFRDRGIQRKIRLLGRLDRDTTGVMVVCKNPYALYKLDRAHTREKTYHALVCGQVKAPLCIDEPIGMGDDSMVREVRSDGQPAITRVWPLQVQGDYSLVKIQLETGRTHQIRCHLSHIGHPVLGDGLYGGQRGNICEIFLHVRSLNILHPRTGEPLTLVAPYPKDKVALAQDLLKT